MKTLHVYIKMYIERPYNETYKQFACREEKEAYG